MRTVIVVMFVTVIASLLMGSFAAAADKAATSRLPAALTAAGVQPDQVLASSAAEQVRGECLWLPPVYGPVPPPGFDVTKFMRVYAAHYAMICHGMPFVGYHPPAPLPPMPVCRIW